MRTCIREGASCLTDMNDVLFSTWEARLHGALEADGRGRWKWYSRTVQRQGVERDECKANERQVLFGT